ncbi:MAG: DUF423 domain-containing protein [Bacteroidota bacterium]
MHKGFLKVAFLFAATAVMLGAFGAHGLKKIISETSLQTFETGVRYQFYHAFGLMIAAILFKDLQQKWTGIACWLFIDGIILFSGSLYLLAITEGKYPFIGAFTPIGGVCFIVGWILLFASASNKKIS